MNISMAQVAIAWCLSKEGGDSIFLFLCLVLKIGLDVTAPIVGTTSLQNLEDILSMFKKIKHIGKYCSYSWQVASM
jgi:aryl-alcohol dehydrogenase-like predicted oxidoreductase